MHLGQEDFLGKKKWARKFGEAKTEGMPLEDERIYRNGASVLGFKSEEKTLSSPSKCRFVEW